MKKLLDTQIVIQKTPKGSNIVLISEEELLEIRRLWLFEEGDWEDSIPNIFTEITGRQLNIVENDWAGMGGIEMQILQDICEDYDVPVGLLTELFDTERRQFGMTRRATIFTDIERVLRKDWRNRRDVLTEAGLEPDKQASSSEGLAQC